MTVLSLRILLIWASSVFELLTHGVHCFRFLWLSMLRGLFVDVLLLLEVRVFLSYLPVGVILTFIFEYLRNSDGDIVLLAS